jgi:hypothetical protein
MSQRKSRVVRKRDKNEQEAYENILAEYVTRVRNNELSSYRAAKLTGEPSFFIVNNKIKLIFSLN